eukprot:2040168-Pyramimonas_sp.AAC.1
MWNIGCCVGDGGCGVLDALLEKEGVEEDCFLYTWRGGRWRRRLFSNGCRGGVGCRGVLCWRRKLLRRM